MPLHLPFRWMVGIELRTHAVHQAFYQLSYLLSPVDFQYFRIARTQAIPDFHTSFITIKSLSNRAIVRVNLSCQSELEPPLRRHIFGSVPERFM